MAIMLACGRCGRSFNVEQEHADKGLRCPDCNVALRVGRRAPAAGSEPFRRDKFLLSERGHWSARYDVCDDEGRPVLFVERPFHYGRQVLARVAGFLAGCATLVGGVVLGLALDKRWPDAGPALFTAAVVAALAAAIVVSRLLGPKRHILFYTDAMKSAVLLEVLQDQLLPLLIESFTVRTASGEPLAVLEKHLFDNMFTRTWRIVRPDRTLWATVRQYSVLPSAIWVPLGADPQDFVFCSGGSREIVGEFTRKRTWLDRYVLDMSADGSDLLDRRVAVAMGVLLDTAEGR